MAIPRDQLLNDAMSGARPLSDAETADRDTNETAIGL
jgi:hypothetical protein